MPSPMAQWLGACALSEDLDRVEVELRAAVCSEDRLVAAVCGDHVRHGGKRLRPALLLLTARLGGHGPSGATGLAAALELLHTGTLFHDDIVDEAATRRFRPSANARWGNSMAVAAGGFLLSRAMQLFAAAGDDINRCVGEAVRRVCRGQMLELQHAGDLDLSESHYFTIIADKTSALYELACRIGGMHGGLEPRHTDALTRYAADVGVGFQLIDDLLDLVGDERALGKPRATDVRGGIYTLPVLHTLARGDGDALRLRAILGERELSHAALGDARALLDDNGSIEYARSTARTVLLRARDWLNGLPPGPALDALVSFPAHVFARAALANAATAAGAASGMWWL